MTEHVAMSSDLPGFGRSRGDDAVGVGLELRIRELVAREIERAAGALDPALGFVSGGVLAVEIGNRCEAAGLQRRVALRLGRGLRKI